MSEEFAPSRRRAGRTDTITAATVSPVRRRASRQRIPAAQIATSGPGDAASAAATGHDVNDVHSRLNPTRVARIVAPDSLAALQAAVRQARREGQVVAVAGGRHAMGGQQFADGGVLLDTSRMNRVLRFDPDHSEIEVEAGIRWPALIAHTVAAQHGRHWRQQVGIRQKQTGADALSLGGALAANIHGRGLRLMPFVGDVESFVLVGADGAALTCSRQENAGLFRLVAGGYGLFGVVARVTLRLAPRRKIERVVRLAETRELPALFEQRIPDGFLYGDFQFMTDPAAEGFLRTGIFSCYRPVADETLISEPTRELSANEWQELLYLAHADRRRAFELYAAHYLATSGQIYWTDTHQLSFYLDDYHRALDQRLGASATGGEMITELYVPRERLAAFMDAVREDFRAHQAELIYGTVRLIERDDVSFLAWARESFACIVFNLHVTHDAAGIARARSDFRRLIDRAIEFGGNYYLTYHRWATREQALACYPQLPEFLRLKQHYDPTELFQSDWYRHFKLMFADVL
ncbi:MAG: FAD-binding oxidoreductase [Pyrinomonadaceae bacterium]|nr:FAD-binding oxidoreductase [Pyrinomonadaceae bacterium]MDQ3135659.1 FAD-binding oxidoreductase [Acidobacteriota bacterium]